MDQEPVKDWSLEPETELRIEVDHGQKIKIKLTQGTAEIFGTELALNAEYLFTGNKFAVFSWNGCVLQVQGTPSVAYTAGDTPMYMYLNAHLVLEQQRIEATRHNMPGPRVMIVGPADVGKTSICKILLNYCIKQGRKPMFVDLDTNQGSVTLPGTLTATSLSKMIDAEEDLGSTPLTTNTTPIAYYYGYSSPLEKPKFYSSLADRLSSAVLEKLEIDQESNSSGIIINSCYQFVEGSSGFEAMKKVISAFRVNVVFVISHERMFNDLTKEYAASDISVVKLAKSGGVVNRDQAFRRNMQSLKIREYFYGNPNTALGRADLNPYSTTISFGEIAVHRVGEGILAPSSALPLGEDRKIDETRMVTVNPGNILLHSVLALSDADLAITTTEQDSFSAGDESEMLLATNIAGFIYVANVDETKKKLTVLSPSPGKLPKKHLIMGALKWLEMQ